jgi:tetratricopeptide (TPR) repeat protein
VRSTAGYLSAIALLLAVAVALQVWRDRGWQPYEPATPILWLENADTVRRLSLGFDNLIADVYWMRAVVYYGRQRLSEAEDKNYDLLYPFLNFVTTLDWRFKTAYRFGAVFLSEPPPGGPGRPDLAVDLLNRGLERSPLAWEYPHDVGFVYFWVYGDYQQAADWYERASRIEGAPLWLKSTTAAMRLEGGDRDSARVIWRQMYESADDEWLRNEASTRLAQFDALDAIDELNTILWRYAAQTGRVPERWDELVRARVLRGVPLDPAGVPYEIDQVNEDVKVSEQSPLSPMPLRFKPAPR